jgi:acetaldehyde dehydrogenase (acetylating)
VNAEPYGDGSLDLPLFEMTPIPLAGKEAVAPTIPVAWASCPRCTASHVALLGQGEHLTWKRHTYTTWSGVAMECSSSGVALCVLKPKDGHLVMRATRTTMNDGENLRRQARCIHEHVEMVPPVTGPTAAAAPPPVADPKPGSPGRAA